MCIVTLSQFIVTSNECIVTVSRFIATCDSWFVNDEMKTFSFEKLEVYVEARKLVSDIYGLSRQFPNDEMFALINQIRRAAVSITSNIAEGTSRSSKKDKAHFVEIAYGSLMEVVSQLQIAVDLNYITVQQYEDLLPKIELVSFKLFALRRSYTEIENKN